MTVAPRGSKVPGDLILEPNERVLVASHPLVLWEVYLAVWVPAGLLAAWGLASQDPLIGTMGLVPFVLLGVAMVVKWVPWRARWFVLTDRRVISRWGVFNRNQAAILLDRIQDAHLARPFPVSLIRDYGVIHVETAGELSDETISAGLRDLKMTRASEFYRAMTDAMTPDPTEPR